MDRGYKRILQWIKKKDIKQMGGGTADLEKIVEELRQGIDLCRAGQAYVIGRLHGREEVMTCVRMVIAVDEGAQGGADRVARAPCGAKKTGLRGEAERTADEEN